jgi:hypothetical protein
MQTGTLLILAAIYQTARDVLSRKRSLLLSECQGEVPSEFLWRSSLVLTQKADEVGRVQGFFLIASMFGVLCLLLAVVTWMWGHS